MQNNAPIWIFICYIFVAVICIGLLYYRQVVNQYKPTPFDFFSSGKVKRGNIFFTDKFGKYPAAATSIFVGKRLIVDSQKIVDAQETFSLLQNIVSDIDEEDFINKTKKKKDPYIVVENDLKDEEIEKFKKLKDVYYTSGIHLEKIEKRKYPFRHRASHVLGFVGYDEKSKSYNGRYGLESYYQSELESGEVDESIGIVTSIEPNVQNFLEVKLQTIKDEWDSKLVGGIVLDPRTGEIVASAVVPTFDPNVFNKEKDVSIYRNPIVENVYEFGSIFKPITVAIGIDSNSVELDDTYHDKGFIFSNGRKISNYDGEGRGPGTTIQAILSDSLNTGIAFLIEKTGNKIFAGYLNAFALQDPTGVDLPREKGGLVSNLKNLRTIEYITAGYGQGIAITPISMIRILSTLANDGVAITPKIVTHQKKNDVLFEVVNKNKRDIGKRIFDKETTDEVTKMLVKIYDEDLYGGRFKNPNYQIAIKTGTALMVDPKTRKYSEDKVLHSFFGYFPASKPEFLVLLFGVGIDRKYFAASSLTRPFSEISDYLISYYDLLPDR